MQEEILVTTSYQETQKVGENFSKKLKGGEVLALYGDLGSGKTTFVQGLAKGLGIKRRIISPTFIVVRTYKIKNQKSKIKSTSQNAKFFYHIDLYRIENQNDIKRLGIEEIINDPQNIVAIEWAEKLGKRKPRKRVDIDFKYADSNKRRISIRFDMPMHRLSSA